MVIVNSSVCDCGIDDLPPAGSARMTETVVMHQGIFENAFTETNGQLLNQIL
jgi:hypothetical protein